MNGGMVLDHDSEQTSTVAESNKGPPVLYKSPGYDSLMLQCCSSDAAVTAYIQVP
jgi:hypothetical protein